MEPPVSSDPHVAATTPQAIVGDICASESALRRWRDAADHHLASEGAGHLVHDLPVRADGRTAALESRPWRLDPVPYVLSAVEFEFLASVVRRRMMALEEVLADVYGPQRLVRDGVIPPEVLHSASRYRAEAVGASPRRWLSVYGVDVRRSVDGTWQIVQDLTDAPVGLGYTLLDRSVMSRIMPDRIAAHRVAPTGDFVDVLRQGWLQCQIRRVHAPLCSLVVSITRRMLSSRTWRCGSA
jgi:uncharacterized circularly permuted ATP-grasp superfamily protein